MPLDQAKLEKFVERALGDIGSALTAGLVVLGDKLGLYRAMADGQPLTAAELASRTNTAERYVREWLAASAAGGYVEYDAASGRYTLPPEHAAALVDETSPAFVAGGFQSMVAALRAEPLLSEAFRSGKGVGWHEHDPGLFEGTRRFFKPGYVANLVGSWLPALEGVVAKLERGAEVADVGCGLGVSTMLMARAFPQSRFVGFDYHPASIERARAIAADDGLADRVRFEVAAAKDFPGQAYDLVTCFDCLHDMGDPVGAAAHVRQSLKAEGTWMVVEPFAHDRVEDNLNPVGRIYYAASTFICTPASLSQEVGLGLGAQAGEARLSEVIRQGGFSRVRRATETPFNLVIEARP
jgi:SAM-dependent methyltransferase